MAILAIENKEVEVLSTNVVDNTISDYTCGSSPDGNYRGTTSSIVGATDPKYIYYITKTESVTKKDYSVSSRYYYKLFVGDIINRDGKWYKVGKNIDLSYGAGQDNGNYAVSAIGSATNAWRDPSDEFDWSRDSGVVTIEENTFTEWEIVSNNKSGEMVEYSRSKLRTYPSKYEVLDTLPSIGDIFMVAVEDSSGTHIKTVKVITPPSLPSYSDTRYYEELPTEEKNTVCEATKLHPTQDMLPFDDLNTSFAKRAGGIKYKIKSLKKFNSFGLAGVTADTLEYVVRDKNENVVDAGTRAIDCRLDKDGLLDKGTQTVLISFNLVEENGTIEITLKDANNGVVRLGSFFTYISIDEGLTDYKIKPSTRDYNDYTPDHWGQISPAIKAKTKMCTVDIYASYENFNLSIARHKEFQGKFVILDATDTSIKLDKYSLNSLTMRGLIVSVSPEILIDAGKPSGAYRYSINFLEVV